jgi:hypothetical protein
MWDWLTCYPSVRIEQIGTPYEKIHEPEDVNAYDYIVVGGEKFAIG